MKIFILENEFLKVSFLALGATIYSFEVKNKGNRNIVLTTKNPENYKTSDNGYFGATVGPVAGRISNASFTLDGKTINVVANEKETNSLHGGPTSFAFKDFALLTETDDQLIFEYMTSHNEGGYPGIMTLRVIYKLVKNTLQVQYFASVTEKTIINITNHSYFNLNGHGTILDHTLYLDTHYYYELDDKQINIRPLKIKGHDLFNFRRGKKLGEVCQDPSIVRPPMMGLDHLFVVESGRLVLENDDLRLTVNSSAPAYQLYATNFPPSYKLLDDSHINLYHGLAIEPVEIVSAINGEYKNLELSPDTTYERTIEYIVDEI